MAEGPAALGELVRQAPLSFNQQFLSLFDRGDDEGPFGPAYHIVHGWRIRGRVEESAMRSALADVVARHEALRTLMVRQEPGRQEIHPAAPAVFEVRDLAGVDPADRESRAEQLLIEIEAGDFPVRVPLLRAVLARFDDQDAVLVVISHHTATDGWSMRIIARDIATRYAVHCGFDPPELPDPKQYRDFVDWQQAVAADASAVQPSREYWREQLRDAGIFTFPTDRPRSANLPQATAVHRFLVEAELVEKALKLGKAVRGSPFMVMFAAFALLAHRVSGATDVVAPTFTPGRGGERFQYTVGSFFNFIPLRIDLSTCRTFRDVVGQVRDSCLDAYAHDIPQILNEAPALMAPAMQDDQAPPVFQVFTFPFLLDREVIGDMEYSEIRRRLVSQARASDIPDGQLWTLNLDTNQEMIGSVSYKTNLYDDATVVGWVTEYRQLLEAGVTKPDAPL